MNNQTPQQAQSLIEVKNLSFKRGERVIYDNVSLNIRRGQITAIMGPSGTGKTTLLRLIGGQLTPDQGEVLLDGKPVEIESPAHAQSLAIGIILFAIARRIGSSLARYEFHNTSAGGVVEFASFQASQAHERKRMLQRLVGNVGYLILALGVLGFGLAVGVQVANS